MLSIPCGLGFTSGVLALPQQTEESDLRQASSQGKKKRERRIATGGPWFWEVSQCALFPLAFAGAACNPRGAKLLADEQS